MKKLQLDTLTVDSFPTTPRVPGVRGTVAGRENNGIAAYPDTWVGTCWETCAPRTAFCTSTGCA